MNYYYLNFIKFLGFSARIDIMAQATDNSNPFTSTFSLFRLRSIQSSSPPVKQSYCLSLCFNGKEKNGRKKTNKCAGFGYVQFNFIVCHSG